LSQLANLVDAVVCSAVNLDDIYILTNVYRSTTVTFAAGLCGGGVNGKAIEGFCQYACHSCFANAARACKQVSVRDSAGLYGVFECLSDGVLADNVIERLRPVFSCKNNVSHF
jgi:hypothetical protein